MSVSLNRWISITLLTLASYGPVAMAADVKTSLGAGDAGKIRAALVPGDLKYALHIPFYGGCNQYAKTTGAPILLFAGTKDDYFKIEDCQKNVDTLKNTGANLKFVVYEGAMHGFDTENPRAYVPRGQTAVQCSRLHVTSGQSRRGRSLVFFEQPAI